MNAPSGCCDGQCLEGGQDTAGVAERTAFVEPEEKEKGKSHCC